SQREYYQLFAYFTGIKEPMVSANHNQPLPPLLKVASAEQTAKLKGLRDELAQLQREVAAEAAKVQYRDPLANDAGAAQRAAEDVSWLDDAAPPGAKLAGDGETPWQWGTFPAHPVFSGKRSAVRSGPGLHSHHFTGALNPVRILPDDKL